jgi:hypothetical protein
VKDKHIGLRLGVVCSPDCHLAGYRSHRAGMHEIDKSCGAPPVESTALGSNDEAGKHLVIEEQVTSTENDSARTRTGYRE